MKTFLHIFISAISVLLVFVFTYFVYRWATLYLDLRYNPKDIQKIRIEMQGMPELLGGANGNAFEVTSDNGIRLALDAVNEIKQDNKSTSNRDNDVFYTYTYVYTFRNGKTTAVRHILNNAASVKDPMEQLLSQEDVIRQVACIFHTEEKEVSKVIFRYSDAALGPIELELTDPGIVPCLLENGRKLRLEQGAFLSEPPYMCIKLMGADDESSPLCSLYFNPKSTYLRDMRAASPQLDALLTQLGIL